MEQAAGHVRWLTVTICGGKEKVFYLRQLRAKGALEGQFVLPQCCLWTRCSTPAWRPSP